MAIGDHVANAARRPNQLGHDHIRPGPAQHETQGFGNVGRGTGDEHARDDAFMACTQRVGCLHQVAPRAAHSHGHHQRDLKDRTDEDDQNFLRLANAGPQDQQRDKSRGRQIAAKRNEGLKERLDALVSTHGNAQRHGDDCGQDEAAEHTPHRHADVLVKAVLCKQQPALLGHGDRAG
ncbi:hypothetical protein D3C71_749350 [compost metagenome]